MGLQKVHADLCRQYQREGERHQHRPGWFLYTHYRHSTYTVGTNLQENRRIRLSPCNFDNTTRTLTVTNLGTATSDPGELVP